MTNEEILTKLPYAKPFLFVDDIISIDEEGVSLPTTKVGYLKWDAIQRLIIKHRILTLDAYGNKLYQLDLEKDQELNIEEIEAYSMQRIKEEKKLIKNDW